MTSWKKHMTARRGAQVGANNRVGSSRPSACRSCSNRGRSTAPVSASTAAPSPQVTGHALHPVSWDRSPALRGAARLGRAPQPLGPDQHTGSAGGWQAPGTVTARRPVRLGDQPALSARSCGVATHTPSPSPVCVYTGRLSPGQRQHPAPPPPRPPGPRPRMVPAVDGIAATIWASQSPLTRHLNAARRQRRLFLTLKWVDAAR